MCYKSIYMHKLILAIIVIISMSSCGSYKAIPLSQKYKPDPVAIIKSPRLTKDQAWDRAVRLFAEKNISIKMIDKSSGYIQSDIVSFVSAYQIDSAIAPTYPAYVVTQQESAYKTVLQPSYITGHLKIFILNDSNQTEVRVNIEDLSSYHMVYVRHGRSSVLTQSNHTVVSTGVLESEMADHISTGAEPIYGFRVRNGEILNPNDNYSQYSKRRSRAIMGAFFGCYGGFFASIASAIIIVGSHKKH